MPGQPIEKQVAQGAATLAKKPAKRLHEVIAGLKVAHLQKQSRGETPEEAAKRLDPDLPSNLKRLDELNQVRSKVRKQKRRRRTRR